MDAKDSLGMTNNTEIYAWIRIRLYELSIPISKEADPHFHERAALVYIGPNMGLCVGRVRRPGLAAVADTADRRLRPRS